MSDTPEQAQPGSQEYAANAHMAVERLLGRLKSQMPGGEDLLTILWSVAYENREGRVIGIDGEPNDLIETMAIGILKLADAAFEKVALAERFLPDKNKTSYAKIVANIETQLMLAIKHMTQDKTNVEKEAHIIVPRTDDGLIRLPDAHIDDKAPDQDRQAQRAIQEAERRAKQLGA